MAEARKLINKAARNESTELDLSDFRLTFLPESIWQLTNLRKLNLSGHFLTALPDAIGNLAALQSLYLHDNQLSILPEAVGRLADLRTLTLDRNRLTALPETLIKLSALEVLQLSDNQLTVLPDGLSNLTKLQTLFLCKNQLTTLPEGLNKLASLRTLDAHKNRLTALPEGLGNLTALQSLMLSRNQLTTLPEGLENLTALQTLDLSGNELSALPEGLGKLTRLDGLFLHGNPGLGLPEDLIGPRWQDRNSGTKAKPPNEILGYYFRVRGAAGRALRECKLIVVGRGGAGKTSLIKRLAGEPYNPLEPETHGINIRPLKFECADGPITARVWDFGGQVVLHSMHEFFLTARSLYLLVLGERSDMLERDAAYWLQLIRSYAGNAPVIVALNKSAARQRQFDRAALEKNYEPILGWVHTECSESDLEKGGIALLERTIKAALESDHMESVRRKFPAKWFAIKDELEGMKESYLDYPAYVRRCETEGEKDTKEQAALAGDLHDLGIALNFGRDPRLRDTTVLRPDWLANGIYAVLRANDLDGKLPIEFSLALAPEAIVDEALLERIHRKAEAWGMLKAADYPQEKRRFLLQLMDSFHLSYPLDQQGRKYLVPSLLPLEQPSGAVEPEGAERARLRYEFSVVPAPLLLWFIARTFSLTPNRLHWRRGAYLVFGEAKALVWTTQDERYVFITAAGAQEDRADLLTMIRGTLAELFRAYQGLRVTEQWWHEGEWVPRKTLEKFKVLKPEEWEDASEVGPGRAGAVEREGLET